MKDKKKRILILGALTTLLLACVLLIVLNSCSSCDGEHSWGEWEVLEEATCAQEGEQAHTCRRCHKTETEAIPTFEHNPAKTLDSGETRHWNACKACDAKCNAEYHEYGKWEVAEEATCDKDGSRKRVCKVCKHEDAEVIPAKGHVASEGWSIDKNKHYHTCTVCGGRVKVEIHQYDKMTTVKKATAAEDGLQTGTCTVCGHNGSKTLARTGASSITFDGKHSVTVGGTLQLSATVSPDSVTDKSVTWSSLNKDVATVTKDGKLTAHKLGRVQVVAKAANGYEEVFTVYVTETAIDGNINDKCYGKTEPFNWMDKGYNIGENTSIYFGKDGLYLADRVSDDQVQGNGDTSRIETFITLSDVFSMSDTFVVRYYPNGYSKTGSNIRVFEYENADSKYRFRELEKKNKDLPDISAEIKYSDGGYDIEAFIPWNMFELTEAPAKIYYQSVGCAKYGTSSGMKYATYEEDVKKYTESGIYDIENYIEYDKKGFVYKEVFMDKEKIVMGNESIAAETQAYTTEFYLHKLNDLNPLTGAKFKGTGSKYIKELGNGYYRLEVPYSARAQFEEAQTITIVDSRELGKKFTLRIFDGTLVDDLAITYRGQETAPVLYGTNKTLDMSKFAATTAESDALDYDWTLTYNGQELTDVDMAKEYAFTKAGEYVITADISTDGYEGSASQVIYVLTPEVYVSYDGGKVVNTGTNTAILADTYKLDQARNSTRFVAVDQSLASYTEGINKDKKGAIVTNHKNGAYTVVNDYNFGTGDFTVSTWFNVPVGQTVSTGSSSFILGTDHPDRANDGFAVSLKSNALRVRLLGATYLIEDLTFDKEEWYSLTLTREGGKMNVYLDGTLLSSYNIDATCDFGTKDLAFGAHYGFPYEYHNGNMYFDDVQIYGEILTEEQLQAIAGIDEMPAREVTPQVKVTYTGGKIENSGEATNLTVGAYKLDKTPNATKFVETTDVTYTTGILGDANGAISMKHNAGAYTAVKGYQFGTNDFTISTWFNVPTDSTNVSTGAGTYLFGNCQPDEKGIGFALCLKKDQIRFRLNGGNQTPKITYEKGIWNNMVLSREGDTLKLYFNGTILGVYELPEGFDFGTKDLAFGGYYGFPNNYHGNTMYYDNIEVYGEALTAEEIKDTIINSVIDTSKPVVEITYTGKKIANTGLNPSVTVGAYKLDKTPNSTKFVSTTSVSYTKGIDGDANGAISMKHNSGAYTVVDKYNFGTEDFTISTWFNVPFDASQDVSTSSGTYLFGINHPDAKEGFAFSLKKDTLRIRLNGETQMIPVSYELDTWHNLVLSREGGALKIFFNGKLVNTSAISDSCDFGTKDLAFGGYYGFPYNYHGNKMYFDNIQIYDGVLEDAFISYAVQATNHKQEWFSQSSEMTTLFVGDSFFSESYWSDFYDTYKGKDVLLAGIAGTTTYDWNIFADTYLAYTNPKNLVVHLGTNDIHDDGDNAQTTIQNLQALFTKIHALKNYEDTKIYYFGIPYKKSTMYGNNASFSAQHKKTIDAVNAAMKTWCEEQGWITYIDDLTGGAIKDEQFRDNTHLTLEDYDLVTDALAATDIFIADNGLSFESTTTYRTNDKPTKTANTLSSWIYLPTTFGDDSLGGSIWGNYEKDDVACTGYDIITNGAPRFFHINKSGKKINLKFTDVDVRVGNWVNLTFVIEEDAKTVSCYVNGELKQQLEAEYKITLDEVTSVYTLGGDSRSKNPQYFKGRILELALYKDSLSANAVKALYVDGLAQTTNAPFTYYQLEMEDRGKDIPDVKELHDLIARNRYYTEKTPVTDYAYSFAVIGDPQIVSINDINKGQKNLTKIYDWILANKDAKNIQYVFNMGDITDGNLPAEWAWAQEQNARMDGIVPYSVIRGNHDLIGYNKQEAVDYFSQYMGTDAYRSQFQGFYSQDNIANSWRTLTIGETKYLLLTLDWGVAAAVNGNPDTVTADKILAWAGDVITSHPDHKVILTTHGFLNHDGTTLDVTDETPPSRANGTYDGDHLWDKFVSQYENIVLVMSGHIPSEQIVVSQEKGVHGNTVTSMLIDHQGVDRAEGSTGMLAMLYFSEDGKTVQVECYSTVHGKYFLESNQFTVDMDKVIEEENTEVKPVVNIDYTGGKVTNKVADSALTVGAYKINSANNGFETSTNALYTTGMDGDKNGALRLIHNLNNENAGAYTVVKNYEFGTNNFTISTWFNIPTSSSNASGGSGTYLFGTCQPDETGTGFAVCLKSNAIRFRVNGSNAMPSITYAKGTWNNMVLCREGNALKLYFNGTLVNTTTLSDNFDFGTKDLAFGGYHSNKNNYHGNTMYYDNILVYSQALTTEYIKENIVDGTSRMDSPILNVTYTGGKITNDGTNTALKVGTFGPNVEGKFTSFVAKDGTYVNGMGGDANGALSMQHTKGAYTVVEDYNFGTNDFTISTWFNVPTSTQDVSGGSGTYLFGNSQPDETGSGFSVCLKKNAVRFRVNGSNAMSSITYAKGTWNHMVLCREGDALKLYFNGVLVNTTTLSEDYSFGTKDLAFGGYYGNKSNYHGNVMYYDNVQMYSEAITAEQVNNLYSNLK